MDEDDVSPCTQLASPSIVGAQNGHDGEAAWGGKPTISHLEVVPPEGSDHGRWSMSFKVFLFLFPWSFVAFHYMFSPMGIFVRT